MHKAVKTTLASLQQASYTGLDVTLADGSRHKLYPRALSYVADDPEQHAVLQVKSGIKTKRQCVRCYLATDLLAAVQHQAQLRTLACQQHIRATICEAAITSQQAAEAICKEYGTHPEECGLWGFDGEHNPQCKCQHQSPHWSDTCLPTSQCCTSGVDRVISVKLYQTGTRTA
jgi:hypothetical protein